LFSLRTCFLFPVCTAKTNFFSFVFTAIPKNAAQSSKSFTNVQNVLVIRPTMPVVCGIKPNPKRHRTNYTQGDTIHCVAKFFNPIKVSLTNAKAKLSITGQSGQEEANQVSAQKQTVQQTTGQTDSQDVDDKGVSVAGAKKIVFSGFQFKLMGQTGLQYVSAAVTTDQLKDLHGTGAIYISANPQAVLTQSAQEISTQMQQGINTAADGGSQQQGAQLQTAAQSAQSQAAAKIMEQIRGADRPSAQQRRRRRN